jgi:murein DD-endopeptidase MepM/ murein hydrolase activator NlpD
MNVLKISFLVILLLLCFLYVSAGAFQIEVSPHEIGPGDAFIVKVTGIKTARLPAGSLGKNRFYFTKCGEGCFLAIGAVGIKTKPGDYILKLRIGEKTKNLKLFIKHTDFPAMRLTLSKDKVSLSPEDKRRVKRENKRLKAIFRRVSRRLWEGDFLLPLENDLSTVFGTKRIINNKKISVHSGVDIRGQEGEEVLASNNGKVVFAKELFLEGNTVILDHGLGIYTIYMHLSGFNVNSGNSVSKGDVIGFVGSSGRSSGPHLHFGVKVRDMNVNPVSFVELEL